jgi:hypothetical protein
MKTIIIVIIFSSGLMFAQTVDSLQVKKQNQEQNQVKAHEQQNEKLQSQIGPKGEPQTDVKENRKKKDVFIDKDGDGICDSRQSGMSFNKMRKRQGSGQKGPGGPGGSGGNGNGANGNTNGSGSGGAH